MDILLSYQCRKGTYGRCDDNKHPVAMRQGETPVPIPNTMVKTLPADGTMLETAWKSRWLPDLGYNIRKDFIIYIKTEAKASVCTLKTT